MHVSFNLPIEPFSVNRMYYRDKRHKTQEYKSWEQSVLNYMRAAEPQAALKKIREAFVDGQHGFVVRFTFNFPSKILFNQQGSISSRAEDLSNVEKPLLDLIFLPKIHVQPFPMGCKNVNVDDKCVLRLTSTKRVSPTDNYSVQISIGLVKIRPVVGP